MSFSEKSLWVMLVGLVAAFGFYFATALPNATINVTPPQIVLFVVAVVLLVITQVVGQILLVLATRHTRSDERDRFISLKGSRNAAYVLAAGVFVALCTALLTVGNYAFVHVLLGFWVAAQLVEIASQLFLYRRQA